MSNLLLLSLFRCLLCLLLLLLCSCFRFVVLLCLCLAVIVLLLFCVLCLLRFCFLLGLLLLYIFYSLCLILGLLLRILRFVFSGSSMLLLVPSSVSMHVYVICPLCCMLPDVSSSAVAVMFMLVAVFPVVCILFPFSWFMKVGAMVSFLIVIFGLFVSVSCWLDVFPALSFACIFIVVSPLFGLVVFLYFYFVSCLPGYVFSFYYIAIFFLVYS